MSKRRTIKVDYLARVEGEGAMWIDIQDGKVADVKLKIYEPPRFFEGFMVGREYREAPDITARICGICPVAYQMSSSAAMEDALNLTVNDTVRRLRRLLYCGEWIQSHALHVYFLHAPDFLGLQSSVELAASDPARLQMGMRMKGLGNELMTAVGGRAVHPVNVRVGGFYSNPANEALQALLPKLEQAKADAIDTVRWVAGFDFPAFEQDYELVALDHPDSYAIEAGTRIHSNRGLDIPVAAYENHFEEFQEPHSHALHARHIGHGSYMTGPLARFALNFDKLSPACRELAAEVGVTGEVRNPFKSIVIRSIELLYCVEEAIRLIEGYDAAGPSFVEGEAAAGSGCACTEAPRGILYHRYELDDAGMIRKAKIVPPTSQNQGQIEADLRLFTEQHVALDDERLQWHCEQAIRNYDPCISCATHFLKLHVNRR
jgi:coenzyme F420-reducing hydrogenase alpha subunit